MCWRGVWATEARKRCTKVRKRCRDYGFTGRLQVPTHYRRNLVQAGLHEFLQSPCQVEFAPWQHRPCDKGSGKTSLVEGLNNKWRNRVAGLVRKTVCVRYLEDLDRRLWIVFEAHNQLCLKQLEKLISSTE